MLQRRGPEPDEPLGGGGAVRDHPGVDPVRVAPREVAVGPRMVDRHRADELDLGPRGVHGGEPVRHRRQRRPEGRDLLAVERRARRAGGPGLLGAGGAELRRVGDEGLGLADEHVGVGVDDGGERSDGGRAGAGRSDGG